MGLGRKAKHNSRAIVLAIVISYAPTVTDQIIEGYTGTRPFWKLGQILKGAIESAKRDADSGDAQERRLPDLWMEQKLKIRCRRLWPPE